MIIDEMISVTHSYSWKKYIVFFGVFITFGATLLLSSNIFAVGGVGTGGNSSGTGGNYNTDYGFGWRLFNATETRPSTIAGFNAGSWSTVYTTCKDVGQVWVYLIFNKAKTQGVVYNLHFFYKDKDDNNIGEFERNPDTGRTYYNNYSTNGVYYNDHYIGNKSENTVHGYFDNAISTGVISNPNNLQYGKDVGWFCYSDKWATSLNTDVDKVIAEPGERITWTHTLKNDGPATTNANITWRYKKQGDISGQGPETTWPSGRPKNQTTTQTSTYDVGINDIGKTVCQVATASPKASDNTGEASSEEKCVLIAKKPKVQILGSDLIVGRPFSGASVVSGTTTHVVQKPATSPGQGIVFGSWVEYGIFATGIVNGTASGSAFGGSGGSSVLKCQYSTLSFVNAGAAPNGTGLPAGCATTTNIGVYSTAKSLPDIGINFPVRAGLTSVYDDTNSKPQGLYTSNDYGTPVVTDPITLGARTLTRGQWVVINAPNAEVTISGNLTYENGPFQSISDIPQFIIIAKNIHINPNVTQVDAWLIAKGSTAGVGILDTCAVDNDYTRKLIIDECKNVLQVNGPVIAQKVWYRRTGGEMVGAAKGGPSEIFNLRPDAYMWLYARASTSGRIQSVYTRELPPRF